MCEGVEMDDLGVQGVVSDQVVCCEMGAGVHTGSIGGRKPGILLSNSSRPGGLER